MTDAIEVHAAFMTNGVGADDVFWKALSYCKACITNASTGVGAASDGWSKHLSAIKSTLSEIENLHREQMGSGSKLETQFSDFASGGSGLRNEAKY
ncbi:MULTISPECIES: hypothetical protein [Pseudomonas]|uniref:hypothetical protein n=1 Tax=Pseudomonas TaxID=286 RepID=UPI001B686E3A|nr:MULTISPECIES: hypothetical protein [unclassified Pseudomonas]MBP1126701.1 hypothetical protein [Pseudomonas sp. PvP025]MDQ0400561.1 hypothetical protein [Pseudomonas sp. PvP006]